MIQGNPNYPTQHAQLHIKKPRLSVYQYFDLLRNVRKQLMVITL